MSDRTSATTVLRDDNVTRAQTRGDDLERIAAVLIPIGLAGGLFPIFLALWYLPSIASELARNGSGVFDEPIANILGFGAIAFLVGLMWSTFVAVFCVVIVLAFHATTRRRIPSRIMAMIVGGMTGFWCVGLGFAGPDGLTPKSLLQLIGFAVLAMAAGQYAAACGYARNLKKSPHRNLNPAVDLHFRFGIADTLIITAWIAASVAVARSLSPNGIILTVTWFALQVVLLTLGELGHRWRSTGHPAHSTAATP